MAFNPNASNLSEQQIIQQVYDDVENRLRVDAIVTATIADVVIHSSESSITIGNPNNGNTLNVQADGSINVNTLISSASDNILVVGTEDGTKTGTQHVLEVDANKNLHVINMGALVPDIFDDINITYATVAGQTVASIVQYYTGGLAGTLVATLTLSYDGSANLTNVART